jgi:hypothetical protein
VLSIDKNHLASSIRGFYGSEQINTDEYLRRFIDLEYSIPQPSNNVFCKYLFDYFSFSEFFYTAERSQHSELMDEANYLLKMAELLFNKHNATLRQQEKIFGQTRLILGSFKSNQYTFSHVLFVLIFLKTMRNDVYKKIEGNTLTPQELSDFIFDIMPATTESPHDFNTVYVESLLLHFYNNGQEPKKRIQLIERDADGVLASPIKSKLSMKEGKDEVPKFLDHINHQQQLKGLHLKYLLNKINLIEPLTI